jgi:hypothetical protein
VPPASGRSVASRGREREHVDDDLARTRLARKREQQLDGALIGGNHRFARPAEEGFDEDFLRAPSLRVVARTSAS